MSHTYLKLMSRTVLVALLFAGALLKPSAALHAGDAPDWTGESRIRRGLEAAPVPLDLRGRDRALVGLGS